MALDVRETRIGVTFDQRGKILDLLPIVVTNAFLNILTLTIYRFWGKTRVRLYLWNNIFLCGDRLEYTGTGGELIRGFLIVITFIFLPMGALNTIIEFSTGPVGYLSIPRNIIFPMLVWFLIGIAVYRARRYRLSRTRWRGIRAHQTGSAIIFGLKYLSFGILNLITLGWIYPIMRIRLLEQMINNTWFGDRQFNFNASVVKLYATFALSWFGSLASIIIFSILTWLTIDFEAALPKILTKTTIATAMTNISACFFIILLVFCWYKAREISLIARSTRFEGLTFTLDASTLSLLYLVLGNFLIKILTLGLGLPFAQLRTFRYVCGRLNGIGSIDFESIIQAADRGPHVGEGLADVLDIGAV